MRIDSVVAHAGFYVPAEQASVPLVDRIYSRVGAQDQIAAGRSTFMVEMSETATILNNMSSESLIIFDEVGRGTATEDGLAIAQAILEHLHNDISPAPLTLFATHYRELTDVASQFDDASTHSVSVVNHDGNIVFLHKIVEGAADGSYGVHVASLAGLPESVVLRAKTILASLSKLETLEMPIIGFIGTKDRLHKQFIQFDEDLKALNKDYSVHVYEGAKHAFANASGMAYEAEAAEDSWEKTVAFLAKHLD